MLSNYYVNKNAQSNGDLHKDGCEHAPNIENRKLLGQHSSCSSAVTEAKKYYNRANGCFYCSKECHTS